MTDWLAALAPIAVAVFILLAPGATVVLAMGIRGLMAVALAGPVSVAFVGAAAVAAALVGLPFGWWWPAGAAVLVAAGALLLQRRSRPSRAPVVARPSMVLPLCAAALLATVVAAGAAFGDGTVLPLPTQTYDGVFHLNAAASILESGDGSSFTLYRLSHPGEEVEFYPAGWHDLVAVLVQLTGTSVSTAASALWVGLVGAVIVPGTAWLAAELAPPRSKSLAAVIAAVAVPTAATGPYLLLEWGVLFPTALAYAILPAGVGLTWMVLRRHGSARSGVWALIAVWLVAAAFSHPRSLPTFAVLVVPLASTALFATVRRGLADRRTRARTRRALWVGGAIALAAVAAAAVAVLIYFDVGARPISDRLNGGPATAVQGLGESLLQALILAAPSPSGGAALPASFAVAAAAVVGLIVCLRTDGARWFAVAYLLLIVLYTLAAGSNSDFAKVTTGFWYKDKYRLLAAVGAFAPVLAALGAVWLQQRFAAARRSPLVFGLAVGVVFLIASSPALAATTQEVGRNYAFRPDREGALLSRDSDRLLERLPSLVPAGERIAGNPWNGVALSWVVGQREPLFPHFTGDWGDDRWTVIAEIERIEEDPGVCAALERLNAHYLFVSDGLMWGGDPQSDVFASLDRAVAGPGFSEVAREGGSALYRITACDAS